MFNAVPMVKKGNNPCVLYRPMFETHYASLGLACTAFARNTRTLEVQ